MKAWSGRLDIEEGPLALRWHQKIQEYKSGMPLGRVIHGFCSDEGVRRNQGRVGAFEAPQSIRRAIANMAWHCSEPVYDSGDTHCLENRTQAIVEGVSCEKLEEAQQYLALEVSKLIQEKHLPILLGGGHETAYGTWLGIAKSGRARKLGIINFDAHFDLRNSSMGSSGTPFLQIAKESSIYNLDFNYLCLGLSQASNTQALFETANKNQVEWLLDTELNPWNHNKYMSQIQNFISRHDEIYLSIDLDVLPGSIMPAVSAPAALGVDLSVVINIIQSIISSKKLLACDIVELNPSFDQDYHGVKTAARILWELCTFNPIQHRS